MHPTNEAEQWYIRMKLRLGADMNSGVVQTIW
jgi:hypothetical protein